MTALSTRSYAQEAAGCQLPHLFPRRDWQGLHPDCRHVCPLGWPHFMRSVTTWQGYVEAKLSCMNGSGRDHQIYLTRAVLLTGVSSTPAHTSVNHALLLPEVPLRLPDYSPGCFLPQPCGGSYWSYHPLKFFPKIWFKTLQLAL